MYIRQMLLEKEKTRTVTIYRIKFRKKNKGICVEKKIIESKNNNVKTILLRAVFGKKEIAKKSVQKKKKIV